MGISVTKKDPVTFWFFLSDTGLPLSWELGPKFPAQIWKDRIVKGHNPKQIYQHLLNVFSNA